MVIHALVWCTDPVPGGKWCNHTPGGVAALDWAMDAHNLVTICVYTHSVLLN